MDRTPSDLVGNMDANTWTTSFVKQFPKTDFDSVRGWFANAIMSGFDVANKRHAAFLDEFDALRAENAKLYSEVRRINDAAPIDSSVERMSQHRMSMKRIRELEAENARLREALQFYADKEHITVESDDWSDMSAETYEVIEDGSCAREALEQK